MAEIATKTLAEIYFKQGNLKKAYEIYKILSKQDPSDMEIWRKMKELEIELNLPSPSAQPLIRSRQERIKFLEKWLANIRERKRS